MVGSRPAPCDESGKVEPARRGEALERLAQHLALRSERRLRGGHLSIADAALSAVGLPVLEPSTWALLLIGFVSLALPGVVVAAREPALSFPSRLAIATSVDLRRRTPRTTSTGKRGIR
jgi:hypothetical protein